MNDLLEKLAMLLICADNAQGDEHRKPQRKL